MPKRDRTKDRDRQTSGTESPAEAPAAGGWRPIMDNPAQGPASIQTGDDTSGPHYDPTIAGPAVHQHGETAEGASPAGGGQEPAEDRRRTLVGEQGKESGRS